MFEKKGSDDDSKKKKYIMPCGDRVGGQLIVRQVPQPREIVLEVGTLEEPDEGSPVYRGEKQKTRNETVSFRCQGGKM